MIQEVPSEPAGIRHATLRIDGKRAYGWCKAEAGVHRLVRISPFDSSSKRHTSFAQVRTFPVEVGGDEGIKILPSDLRVDTYRAQGAGGQHVNTTERWGRPGVPSFGIDFGRAVIYVHSIYINILASSYHFRFKCNIPYEVEGIGFRYSFSFFANIPINSAVRLTHLATGITAVCQNNRSQHQNKAEAMKILTSKLYKIRQEQLAKEKAEYFSG